MLLKLRSPVRQQTGILLRRSNVQAEKQTPWRVALEKQLFRLKNMPMRVAIAGRQISEMVSHWWCIPGREHEFYVGFWRRKGKKSKRGSKRRRRVWFLNIVETICPSESSKGKHSCSDEKNTSSEDDSACKSPW